MGRAYNLPEKKQSPRQPVPAGTMQCSSRLQRALEVTFNISTCKINDLRSMIPGTRALCLAIRK